MSMGNQNILSSEPTADAKSREIVIGLRLAA
jgi:hypothetical protein